MTHQLLMFLASENTAARGMTQATILKSPEVPPQATALFFDEATGAAPGRIRKAKFMALVVGNAIGFACFIAACWLCLLLIQAFL